MSLLKKVSRHLTHALLVIAVLHPHTNIARAAELEPPSQQDVEEINQAISQIENWLAEANRERPDYEQRLAEVEQQISAISTSAESTRNSIRQTELLLISLNQRIDDLTQDKLEQTELVKKALRSAYMEGSQSYLKLVLNQENPDLATRMLHYYQSFNQSRLLQISQYEATLEELAYSEQQQQADGKTLVNERLLLDTQLEELNQIKTARQQALEQLDTAINQRSGELDNLIEDRAALEQLIEQVNLAIENIPVPSEQVPFDAMKGNLPWPGQGELLNQFGASYGDGNLERQGVTIAGAEGSPVQAIHGGRIVFADWLRGSGLLMIIDHGGGYMSLYGHNETLTKSKGAWANAGDFIATAGNSGGQEQIGIYFEIRFNGRPQNPSDWCVRRG